jgi:hypothetical protein
MVLSIFQLLLPTLSKLVPAAAAAADAMVLSIFQLLRSLNPSMQVMTELILPQSMGYLMPVAPC